MARITVEDCLEKTGNENRFKLIHLAVARVKQHRKGQPYLTKGKNKEVVMSLREIAAGEVSFENLHNLHDLENSPEAIDTVEESQESPTAQA